MSPSTRLISLELREDFVDVGEISVMERDRDVEIVVAVHLEFADSKKNKNSRRRGMVSLCGVDRVP